MSKTHSKQRFIDFLLSSQEVFTSLLPSFQNPSLFEPAILELLAQTPQTDPLLLFNIIYFLYKIMDSTTVSETLLQKIFHTVTDSIPGLFHLAKLEEREKKTLEEAFQKYILELIFSEKTPFLKKQAQELKSLGIYPPQSFVFLELPTKFTSLMKILEIMPFREKLGSLLSQRSIDLTPAFLKSRDDNHRLREENERLRALISTLEKKIIADYNEIEDSHGGRNTRIEDFSALDHNAKLEDLEKILNEKEAIFKHLEKINEDYQAYNFYLNNHSMERGREGDLLLFKYSVQKNPKEEIKSLIKSLKSENEFLKKKLGEIHGVGVEVLMNGNGLKEKPLEIQRASIPSKQMPQNKRPRNYDSQLINMTCNSFDQQSPQRIFNPMRDYKSVNDSSFQVLHQNRKKNPFLQSPKSNVGQTLNPNSNNSYLSRIEPKRIVSQESPTKSLIFEDRVSVRPLTPSRNEIKIPDYLPVGKKPNASENKKQEGSPLRSPTFEVFDGENMRRSIQLKGPERAFQAKRTNRLEAAGIPEKETNYEEKGYIKVEVSDRDFKDFLEFGGENLQLLKKACLVNKGVLFEDQEVQFAFVSQTAYHKDEILLKITAYFTNKSEDSLENFEVKFIGNSTLSLWTRNQLNGQNLEPKSQKSQELIIKFHEIPFTALIQKCCFKSQNKLRRNILVIPCAITKFLLEALTDAKEFKTKWGQLKKESVCYSESLIPNPFLVKGHFNLKKYFQYLIELRPENEYDFITRKKNLSLGGLFYVESKEKEILMKAVFNPSGNIAFKVASKKGDFKIGELLVKTLVFLLRKG